MICQKCEQKGVRVSMVINAKDETQTCPRCYTKHGSEENLRTAQFGGTTGGQPNPYAPGTSPFGRGGTGGGNYGINNFGQDKTFEGIISGTHNPPQIDEHRNFEKRLEVYHKHQNEDDMIPYWLTPDEREKLRIKKEVRRRHKWLEQSKKMVDTNSVPYIKQNFHAPAEHMTPKEQQLSALHKYQNGDKMEFEDELPPIIKPERMHLAQSVTHGRTSPFDNTTSDEEEARNPSFDRTRMQTPLGLGNAPLLTKGSEFDAYLEDALNANWGGAEGPREQTLMDYPNADQIGDHRVGHPEKQPSMVDNSGIDLDAELDAFMPIEQQLSKTKKPKSPLRNPNDPYSYWSEYETAKGVGTPGEPLGFADKYSGGSFNPSPIPRA